MRVGNRAPQRRRAGGSLIVRAFLVMVLGLGCILMLERWAKFERITLPPALAVPATPSVSGLPQAMRHSLPSPPTELDDFIGVAERQPDAAEPAKTALEEEYEALVAAHVARLPRPRIGGEYRLKLRDGSTVGGILESVSPGRVVVRVAYGTITYAVQQFDRSTVAQLFPERLAHWRALHDLQTRQAPGAVEVPEARPAPPGEMTDALTVLAELPPAPASRGATASLRYDTAPANSPPELTSTVQNFGQWLNFQHRRVGGKIADRIHAKQQGEAAVLYLQVNPAFVEQPYDTRFQLTEGLWKFWSFRCEVMGVIRNLADAHVVLHDASGRIVGGSTPESSADVWVQKESRGGAAARR